jgi:uncharacterized membrane protein
MDDDTSVNPPPSPKAERAPGPTEAELSRIAREAVHQAPDARLDKQLERMGLLEASDAAKPQAGQATSPPVAADPELERLRADLRRARSMLWMLVAVIAILGVAVVFLLIR